MEAEWNYAACSIYMCMWCVCLCVFVRISALYLKQILELATKCVIKLVCVKHQCVYLISKCLLPVKQAFVYFVCFTKRDLIISSSRCSSAAVVQWSWISNIKEHFYHIRLNISACCDQGAGVFVGHQLRRSYLICFFSWKTVDMICFDFVSQFCFSVTNLHLNFSQHWLLLPPWLTLPPAGR